MLKLQLFCIVTLLSGLGLRAQENNSVKNRESSIYAMMGTNYFSPIISGEIVRTKNRMSMQGYHFAINLLHNIHERIGVEIGYSVLNEEQKYDNYKTVGFETRFTFASLYTSYSSISVKNFYNIYKTENSGFNLLFRAGIGAKIHHLIQERITGYYYSVDFPDDKRYFYEHDLNDYFSPSFLYELNLISDIQFSYKDMIILFRYSFSRGNGNINGFTGIENFKVNGHGISIGLGYSF